MSDRSRRFVLHALFVSLLCVVSNAAAQSTPPSADFDSIAQGPWFDALYSGTPDDMSVLDIANLLTIYPLVVPPGASGRALRVDNSSSTSNDDVILRFTYNCSPGDPASTCRINYAFVGWTFTDGLGIQVFIDDDGSYTDPVYTWTGSLAGAALEDGIQGTQFHDTVNCSSDHLLEIVVQGGALLILDGVLAECVSPVSTEPQGFGTMKSWFE